jgi:DNA-binding winged helix-turn-helix (wHTH) protein
MRVRFGAFEFDSATRELRRGSVTLHLSPKSFDLLQILIERRPALVTKTELQDRLWPDAVVLEANLGNAVVEIRKALGDNARSPQYVWTVSRRGYRFSADVEVIDASDAPRPHTSARWWLIWRDRILPLSAGENIVGRHPESDIWINANSVSRLHARLVVTDAHVTVEDRRSTNGTYVNGARITSRHVLVDGETVTFGSEAAMFRVWSDATAPATERVRSPRR